MPKKYRLKSARVYVITNLVNGKQYVGMTTRTPVQRFEQHCYLALKGSKGRLHQAIREYGANSLKVEKLEEFSSWPEAMEGEIRYIKKLRPEYNATLGGEGGWGAIRTPEFCENLRRRGNLPESQERWAKYVHKGSKSLSRPFIDLITEEVFTSVRKAAIELKVPKGRLYSVLRGNYAERIKNQKTPRVRFLTEPECTARGLRHNPPVQWSACRRERFKAAKQSQCKPVLLLEEGTSFPSLEAALTYLGHPFNARQQSYAHDCIRGKRGFRGWHFEYTPREVALLMRPHGNHAVVNPTDPTAFAMCDRCGRWYNSTALVWQIEWAGTRLYNKQVLVCRPCYDTPQEQLRTIILPPDPLPVLNARVPNFAYEEQTVMIAQFGSATRPTSAQQRPWGAGGPQLLLCDQTGELPFVLQYTTSS